MATTFKWTGKEIGGPVQKGEIVANSKEDAASLLRKKRIVPSSIIEKDKVKKVRGSRRGKVSTKDLVVFTRQFATMIDAGLPLVQALDILAQQTDNKNFGRMIDEIKQDVEGGLTFADA
ncbi:MAG TPA: type II secretion system F family protein, partial [Thermodesulfovibrionia bacterium]|nr:type II secretion system F family protein [Thermodesulfovibrionia bacterium]